jgi:acetyl-CoA carboxylase biotin carboxyl carrier protein
MDIRKVKKLIELLEESSIDEIEVREGEEAVRISRHSSSPYRPAAPSVQTYVEMGRDEGEPQALARDPTPAPSVAAPVVPTVVEGHKVLSPMVGTYYGGAAPSSPPFVEVGARVKKGDVLCIIEAMKIMNQIEADHNGVVAALLMENGQPVEYGQPLFVIK